LLFHRRRGGCFVHPRDLGGPDVEAYLIYLAVERRVAAATQRRTGVGAGLRISARPRSAYSRIHWPAGGG